MRRALLIGSFLVLVAAVYGLWSFRFERVPDARTWSLADLQAGVPEIPGVMWSGDAENPSLRLEVGLGHPKVAMRLGIPGMEALEFVHLSYRISSKNLKPGPQKWEDGRFLIEWHVPGTDGPAETDYAASIRGDQPGVLTSLVVDSESGLAVPALRLEHLGRSGGFELSDLQITPVRERVLWRVGKWFLVAAWLVWGSAWMRSWPGIPMWRALGASAVGLAMAVSFIIPGPWDVIHPLGGGFSLGQETGDVPVATAERNSSDIPSAMIPPSGKLEDKGSLFLRVKIRISQLKLLLHSLLWSGSALVLMAWVGRRPAVSMAAVLALGMEIAQPAFGFGVDWTDLLDLAFDAAGIALALWLYRRWLTIRDGRARRSTDPAI